MSKLWLIAAAAALATLAASRSLLDLPEVRARAVDLRDVINNTMCPIAVEWDEDPRRQPQRIRMLRCARAGPPISCATLPAAMCCAETPGSRSVLQCVELHDKVRVRYGSRQPLYDIAVGCACMLSHAKEPTRVPLIKAFEAYD